ncbi:MAG: hypothetical protein KBE65_10100 [Phycisphaerae bacterium]|nr:hypothetical protein [Phycisphaerae bacterium]
MNTNVWMHSNPRRFADLMAILSLVMVAHGCSSRDRHLASPDATEKAAPGLLAVERFSLAEGNLRLDYRVTNIFPHDIWVCVSTNHRAGQESRSSIDAEICGGTLEVRRRGDLEQAGLVDSLQIFAVYCRLHPGESRSDAVIEPLPVRSHTLRAVGFPTDPVVLRRIVLDVGYFGEDLRDLIPIWEQNGPKKTRRNVYLACMRDPNTAYISYIEPQRWDHLHLEHATRAIVSDVNVPGRAPEE